MRRPLFGAIALASVLSSDGIRADQTGVPCYYDWATARQQLDWLKNVPEVTSAAAACQRGRADTVPWSEYLRSFETSLVRDGWAGPPLAEMRRVIEMLRKERDHLQASRSARTPSGTAPLPADTSVRYLDLDPELTDPLPRPDRITVAPEFRSWVPEFLRESVANTFRVEGRILAAEGEVRLRRGDGSVSVSRLIQKGTAWNLRPGDVFDVTRGRLVLHYDGRRYEVTSGGMFAIGFAEQCMTQKTHRGDVVRGAPVFLIEGTLLYATTATDVRGACVVTTTDATFSVRGTSFTVSHTPSERGGTLSVTVHAGEIVWEKPSTGETALLQAGQSHWGTYARPPSAPGATFQYEWEVQNNCARDLDFRLFELNLRDEVTGSWQTVSIAAGARRRIPIRPTPGGKVCYGAATRQGNLEWGLGLDGSGTCERCCSETLAATAGTMRTASLTCPGT